MQVLRGKDRGKQGRVIDALPKEGRVLVENLNMVKRHQRPRPISDSSRMGGPQIIPGGIIEKAAAGARLERDGRLPDVQEADARRHGDEDRQGRATSAFASARTRAAARRSTS